MTIRRSIMVIITYILTIAFGIEPFRVAAYEEDGAYDIRFLDCNNSTEDLLFLKDKLKDVKIIGGWRIY